MSIGTSLSASDRSRVSAICGGIRDSQRVQLASRPLPSPVAFEGGTGANEKKNFPVAFAFTQYAFPGTISVAGLYPGS